MVTKQALRDSVVSEINSKQYRKAEENVSEGCVNVAKPYMAMCSMGFQQ